MNELEMKRSKFQDFLFNQGIHQLYSLLESSDKRAIYQYNDEYEDSGLEIRQAVTLTPTSSFVTYFFEDLINKEKKYLVYDILNELNISSTARYSIQGDSVICAVTHFYSEIGKFDVEQFWNEMIYDLKRIYTFDIPKLLNYLSNL